jgi:hypothetical protein
MHSIKEMQALCLDLKGKVKRMKAKMEGVQTKLMTEVIVNKNFESAVNKKFEKIKVEMLEQIVSNKAI